MVTGSRKRAYGRYSRFPKEPLDVGLEDGRIAIIAFALLLLFGASRLPQLGSSLGSAIRNFKKGFSR